MTFLSRLLGSSQHEPDEAFSGLRSHALALKPADLDLSTSEAAPIYGVIMETALPEGVATFVCVADGSVSLYTSPGGGTIGLGEHESVRSACLEMLALTNKYAQPFMDACQPASEHPLPGRKAVFFYLLTTAGVYLARCKEAKLVAQEDPLSNLFNNCHGVMAEARKVQEELQAGG